LALVVAIASLECQPCAGPRIRQAGKEGGYLPCCSGTKEVLFPVPESGGYGANGKPTGRTCDEVPMFRNYGCVKGSCGDGVCEPAEAEPCGCTRDCPSAAWGKGWPEPPGGAPPKNLCVHLPPCEGGTCSGNRSCIVIERCGKTPVCVTSERACVIECGANRECLSAGDEQPYRLSCRETPPI
jgi:hypothetical protein